MIFSKQARIATSSMRTMSNGLTAARDLISGVKPPSSISTKTQEYKQSVVEANAKGFYFYNTLALSLITNTFTEASYMFTHTANVPTRHKQYLSASKQAFAFIQGTGLEIMIQVYNLDYDANKLREIFYEKFHIAQ